MDEAGRGLHELRIQKLTAGDTVLDAIADLVLALTGVVDKRLGRDYGELWATLSRAAHHHAYELALTSAELRGWLDDATRVVARLAAAD